MVVVVIFNNIITLISHFHCNIYTVNKQVLVKRRDWCINNSKELRLETHSAPTGCSDDN